jgi:hypothetical protein
LRHQHETYVWLNFPVLNFRYGEFHAWWTMFHDLFLVVVVVSCQCLPCGTLLLNSWLVMCLNMYVAVWNINLILDYAYDVNFTHVSPLSLHFLLLSIGNGLHKVIVCCRNQLWSFDHESTIVIILSIFC